MDVPSSGPPTAPEQATDLDSAALPGRLEVQEEGPATLLLLVARARKPASGRRSRNLAAQWHLLRRSRIPAPQAHMLPRSGNNPPQPPVRQPKRAALPLPFRH